MAVAMTQTSWTWFQTRAHKDSSPSILMVDKDLDDGVQDMLPQNMAPWLIGYFKPKVFEKWRVQEGLSDLPLLP